MQTEGQVRSTQDRGAVRSIGRLGSGKPDLLGQAAARPVFEIWHLLALPRLCYFPSATPP